MLKARLFGLRPKTPACCLVNRTTVAPKSGLLKTRRRTGAQPSRLPTPRERCQTFRLLRILQKVKRSFALPRSVKAGPPALRSAAAIRSVGGPACTAFAKRTAVSPAFNVKANAAFVRAIALMATGTASAPVRFRVPKSGNFLMPHNIWPGA